MVELRMHVNRKVLKSILGFVVFGRSEQDIAELIKIRTVNRQKMSTKLAIDLLKQFCTAKGHFS